MSGIYLLRAKVSDLNRGTSLVKIGMTGKDDLSDRHDSIISDWNRNRGIKVEVLETRDSRNHEALEASLHRKYAQYRVTRAWISEGYGLGLSGDSEWFCVPPRVLWQIAAEYHSVRKQVAAAIFAASLVAGASIGLAIAMQKNAQKAVGPSGDVRSVRSAQYSGANIRSAPNGEKTGFLPNESRVTFFGKDSSRQWCAIDSLKRQWIFCDLLQKP